MINKIGNYEYFVGSAREMLDLTSRFASESQKLMAQALEALAFAHPYKKFYVHGVVHPIDGGKYKINSVKVMDFHRQVCRLEFYDPQGHARKSTQLEFKYDYNIHDKEPRNIRRTSDLRKVQKCVEDIRPITMRKDVWSLLEHDDKWRLAKAVNITTGIDEHQKAYEKLHERFYFGGRAEREIIKNLVYGITSADTEAYKKEYVEVVSQCDAARAESEALYKCRAMVSSNIYGEYAVLYAVGKVNDGDIDTEIIKTFASKDELPDAIKGKVAVLDILSQGKPTSRDDRYIPDVGGVFEVQDLGQACDDVYYVIGKDIYDPRAQSQGQGI